MKASDLQKQFGLTDEDMQMVKAVCILFNGKITRITKNEDNCIGSGDHRANGSR
jgi:hypothetical protein